MNASLPRLRQAVLAARDLDSTVAELREDFGLGDPFADPAVAHFGLRNAVFALGDTFLEVVSPAEDNTAAGRLLERRGADRCGYMAMFQVADLAAARTRAKARRVREVFEVALDDIAEVHLHPADIHGAIVSLSAPVPAESWRWGGEGWAERSVPGKLLSIQVDVADPGATAELWSDVAGNSGQVRFASDPSERGITEIRLERAGEELTLRP